MTTLRPWVLAASLLCGLPAAAAIRMVDGTNPCPGTGSEADPYCSVQNAISAASPTGDTIRVKPGTYQECLNALSPTPKTIVLEAEDPDPSQTVLDGASCFSVSTLVLGAGSTVSGFRMVGGGAGAIESLGSVVITGNLIEENDAGEHAVGDDFTVFAGGGIFADSAVEDVTGPATIDIRIENNTIRTNRSDRDGGGIWISVRSAGDVDAVALVQGNTILGNDAAGVGAGIAGVTDAGFGSSATLRITDNDIQSNDCDAAPGEGADGFGGGIWLSTLGPGRETIAIAHNTVGPPLDSADNTLRNTAERNGGGMSITLFAVDTADHALFIESNVVRGNTAGGGGGGIELFVVGDSLDEPSNPTPGRYAIQISDNDLDANVAGEYGGAILADVGTTNVASRRNPTDIAGNRITGNTAELGGGGVEARSFAEGGPPTFCGVALRHNTVTGNIATNTDPNNDAFAGGLSLFAQADGMGVARIDANYNTITGNSTEIGGGGIDVAGVTGAVVGGNNGTTVIEISNSLIVDNTCVAPCPAGGGFGVGGPGPNPGELGTFRLTLRSSDLSPNEAGAVESLLDPVRVNVCMPASTAAELAFPGIDSDQDVDGVDLLRVATAFASEPGVVHYNPLTDLDGDLIVDGADLSILSASFGDTCP